MLAKFSNCFLFLAIGFPTLFSPFVVKAQDNSKSECGWKYRWVWQRVYEDRYNGTTDRYEPVMVYKPVWEWAYGCEPTSKSNSTIPSSKNSNTSELSEVRPSDLIGTWEGLFDKTQYACTLEIEKVEGNTFYGTLKRQGRSVAVTGTIENRRISFNSAKGMTDNNQGWKLGYNWGSFSNDGKSISGKGANDSTSYEWSFTKKISSATNQQPTTKESLSLKDRLPEQLGEFKRVKLDKYDYIKNFIQDSEERWDAEYQIDKNSKAAINIYRYKDSVGAIKRKENRISEWKVPILMNASIKNQDGQVVGELVAVGNAEFVVAILRNANYFYEIVTKDKMLLEKIIRHLPLE